MKLIYCLHSLCEKQRGGRVRGVATMPLWHGTLLAVGHALRTSGVAFPFVLERLSNPPAHPQEASPHTAVGGRGRATDGGMLTRGGHVAWRQ